MRQISPILHESFRKMPHVNLDYFRIHSKIAKVVHRGRSNFLKSTCDIGDPLYQGPQVYLSIVLIASPVAHCCCLGLTSLLIILNIPMG